MTQNYNGNPYYDSDFARIDRINQSYVKDEYSLKKFILKPEKPKMAVQNDLVGLFEMVTKDLALANLSDDYEKYLYQQQLRNAQNWFVAGLTDLAIIRLANLIGELHLERSKEGLERILQSAGPLSGAVLFRERGEYSFVRKLPQQENQEGGE